MQQSGAVDNVKRTLDFDEVVATFPRGKTIVKRLIKENEDFLNNIEKEKQLAGESAPMFDKEIIVKLVMAAVYGNEIEKVQDSLVRLKRLLAKYDPPAPSEHGVTDEEIARAREYPIKNLVKMKGRHTLCLWHNDKNPSMYFYNDNHTYCFVCNKHADSIDFIQKLNNLDFVAGVRYLLSL